jgi:dTDP-4-dehydrorhamnose 3,5-epimerase
MRFSHNMSAIEGVLLTPLKNVGDERGRVMHVLRSDAPFFEKFGEVYISAIFPGVTKGWKLHTVASGNLAVPIGALRFVLHDTRKDSPTFGAFDDITIGEENYQLLTVPPGVVYAWRNAGSTTAYVINCSTEVWTPEESTNLPLETYSYTWE